MYTFLRHVVSFLTLIYLYRYLTVDVKLTKFSIMADGDKKAPFIADITKTDPNKMRHVETKEKNPLPDKESEFCL